MRYPITICVVVVLLALTAGAVTPFKTDGVDFNGVPSQSVSASGRAVIYFDSDTNTYQCSENGGAYGPCYLSVPTPTPDAGGGGTVFMYWTANEAIMPESSYPNFNTRNEHAIIQYDDAVNECVTFGGVMSPDYGDGGLTFYIDFMAATATSGAVSWTVRVERFELDVTDLDGLFNYGNLLSVSTTVASASGEVARATITATDGAETDNIAAGEGFNVEVCRDGDGGAATDSASGDAELVRFSMKET